MTFNNEIEELKAQIKVLEKKVVFLEEIEKQPRMNLQQEGEYAVVSYHDKVYYRLEGEVTFSWYIKKGVSVGYPVPTLMMVNDAETERLLEGLYYNHIQVKKEKEQRTKTPVEECYKDWWGEYPGTEIWTSDDETRWLGFQAGYHFAYEENVSETPQERVERVHKEMEELIRESVKWCEEHPDESVEDYLTPQGPQGPVGPGPGPKGVIVGYEPTPQTPEQVADGLKEAFRESVKQGVVSSTTKPQTLYDIICDCMVKYNSTVYPGLICDILDAVDEWLPKEQSAAGSQNAYVECSVEGFNDCINKIRRKLR